jgi:signal transduction histidine kinase
VDTAQALRDGRELLTGRGRPGRLPSRPRLVARFGRYAVVGLALVLTLMTWANSQRAGWAVLLVGVLGSVPLALVPFWPLVAWRIAWVAALLSWLAPAPHETSWPWQPVPILVFLAVLFAVATTQRLGVTVGVWVASTALALCEANANNAPGIVIFVTVLMVAGDQLRRRQRVQQELAEEEERSAVLAEREALLAERTRIAREMHDVVAHHMSMIAVRAESAPYRLGHLDEGTRGEFGQISAAAREALTEMRRLLGVLRSERDQPPVAPQPGLPELTALVDSRRQAGEAVEVVLPADLTGLAPAVELTAYRIVQEALSNAARHAPGARAQVVLEREPECLTVTVRNAAPARPAPPGGTGHGLLGMRERAGMLGGALQAGPQPDGGFVVRAVLPLMGDDW